MINCKISFITFQQTLFQNKPVPVDTILIPTISDISTRCTYLKYIIPLMINFRKSGTSKLAAGDKVPIIKINKVNAWDGIGMRYVQGVFLLFPPKNFYGQEKKVSELFPPKNVKYDKSQYIVTNPHS